LGGDERPPLLALVGPTAAGKSALALAWAEAVGAEIIAADSTTVYRGVDIGTAKPSPQDRARVPHHGLDLVEPTESFSVARFQAVADQAAAEILSRGKLPLLVGGTGLWIRAVVQHFPFPAAEDPAGEARARDWAVRLDQAALRRRLRLVDPESFQRIAPGDQRRTVRALAVFWGTGRHLVRVPGVPRYRVLMVGVTRPRDVLARRIAERARAQLQAGLLDEVLGLLARGVPPDAPGLRALGYREGVAWARGRLATHEVLPLMILHHRQYAKRQMTWFRREPGVRWIDLEATGEEAALAQVVAWTHEWLYRQKTC
jgi:tRNA dimethylallyltransferase